MHMLLATICFVVPSASLRTSDRKPDTVIRTSAADLAKEFGRDAEAAKKKYNPNPPPGAKVGGAVVTLTGKVGGSDRKGVYLLTGSNVYVYVKTSKLPAFSGDIMFDGTGRLVGYKDETVTLEMDEVMYSIFIHE